MKDKDGHASKGSVHSCIKLNTLMHYALRMNDRVPDSE